MGSSGSVHRPPSAARQTSTFYVPNQSSVYQTNPHYTQQLPPSQSHPLGIPRNDGSYQFQHTPGGLPYPKQEHPSFPTPQVPPNEVKSPDDAETKHAESSEEDEIEKTTQGKGWSYEKDRIYMMVLSAEEFLGQMFETDQRIRTVSQACERELHRKTIEELLGLRGHLQDELLRIEQMLAKDDPKLRNLNSFEQNFPHVVAKLRELRRKEAIVKAKVIQEELPPSGESGESGEAGTQASGASTNSTGTQSGVGTGASKGVQSSTASTEADLKQRHKEEEKKVAQNYADRFVKKSELSPDDVERLLQDHALSMQALRKRQAGERESMKERMRSKLKNKLKMDKYKGDKEDFESGSSSPQTPTKPAIVTSEDEESDDSDSGEVLADTLWTKMKLQHRMTAEHMQDMVNSVTGKEMPEKPGTPESVVTRDTGGSGDEQETTKHDDEFVVELIKRNRAKMTDAEFAAFLDEYLHDRDSLRKYKAQRKAELDAKLQKKLKGKRDRADGEGGSESEEEELETQPQKSETGLPAGPQEDLDEETVKELKELKADLQQHMGANRKDLSEEDVKAMLSLYRKKQAEIIAARRATRDKHDEKLKEKLKQRSKKKQAKDSQNDMSSSQDDQFFKRLVMRQESGELSKEEFSEMLKEYIGKKKVEEKQRRKELRKRDTVEEKLVADQMLENFRKDKQELHHVRKAERNKMDEKLQRKLQQKKMNREQSGLDNSSMSVHNNTTAVDGDWNGDSGTS